MDNDITKTNKYGWKEKTIFVIRPFHMQLCDKLDPHLSTNANYSSPTHCSMPWHAITIKLRPYFRDAGAPLADSHD